MTGPSRNIFGEIAPLLNPFGLARGLGHAAQEVFAPQVQGQQQQFQMPPEQAYSPPPQQQQQPLFDPQTQSWNRAYAGAMQADAAGQIPNGRPQEIDMSILNNLVGAQAEQGMLPSMDLINGLSAAPQQVPDQSASAGGQYGNNAPITLGSSATPGTLSPFQRPAPTPEEISGQMRQMYLNQLQNGSYQADANLNYMQNDLMRRSQRDQSDDFFGSVLAPIAGGMSNNVAGMNAMGDRWMGQAQDRRGERMNIVNSLIGRQNRAQEYLQATDPTVIKNQVALYNAQTNANKAQYGYQNNQWQHEDRGSERERKAAADAQMANYRNSLVDQGNRKIDEAVRQGTIKRDLADSLIKKNEAWIDDQIADGLRESQKIANQSQQFGQTLEEKKREADLFEGGRNTRSTNTIAAQDQRLDKTIAGRRENLQFTQENINQRTANKAGKDGKPMMSQDFRNLYKQPLHVRAGYERAKAAYLAMPPEARKQLRQVFKDKYQVDPGE